jgi:succinate dehydrogenase/fumarate reductase flavoprotein subunit
MYHIEETDVLIIGAGPAGAMAAIYTHRTDPGLRIAVLDKSKIETSGAAGRGMDALNTIAVPPASQPEDVVEHLTMVTEGVLDQEVAYAYGKIGLRVIKDLEEIMNRTKGDLFPVDENGNYLLYYLHPVDKALMIPMHAEEMKRAMGKAVRQTGARVFDRTPAIKLVTENGRVSGVLAFNMRTGEYFYFKTKAVCLTAGCAGRIGIANSGYLAGSYEFPGNSGDGYAVAYQAGAELVNMECFQASVKIVDHMGPGCAYVGSPRGAKTTNRLGETLGSHPYASGDSRLRVWKHYAEGKGPLYLEMDNLQEEMIRIIEKVQFGAERTSRGTFHRNRGEDYRKSKSVEFVFGEDLGACGGHSSCGINSNAKGAANISGLYVAGDVDGGLPHSYLGGAIGMGSIIGEQAAIYAQNNSAQTLDNIKSWIRREMDIFEQPLKRERGLPTHLVEYKARRRLQRYLLPPKNPDYMNIAIWWMQRIRYEDLPEIKAVDYHDLVKVHEINSILTVGEMMARASLFRDESRWGYQHWRADIPRKKPEWDSTWVVVRKNGSQMECTKRKVPQFKWNFQDWMEYRYPELSFDVGEPFHRVANVKNPVDDPWMKEHLEKEGPAPPRRFLKQEAE